MAELLKSGESYNRDMELEDTLRNIRQSERAFGLFLTSLGYDWKNDPDMCDTPKRVTKIYTREICRGVYSPEPEIKVFPNKNNYDGIVFCGDIDVRSLCCHHFAFMKGKAYVGYIPNKNIIGLSKINRIVDWFSRRPQLQENLTMQIHDYMCKKLPTNLGVAVVLKLEHMCISMRGVEQNSITQTAKLSGVFLDQNNKSRDEFYEMIKNCGK